MGFPITTRFPTPWFGQPRGLTILFLTDLWEVFSYYGMRALLVYYMTHHLAIPQQRASWIYGIYTGCIYLTPIFGGALADRCLGYRRAVQIGGSLMACGHFLMACEPAFYAGLALIVLGNGLFLPSLPGQIASLYSQDDPRRRSAYNIYYAGINLGGLLAPLVCGTLGEWYGWHWGFGAAGAGMLISLAIYNVGGHYLPVDSRAARSRLSPRESPTKEGDLSRLALLSSIVAVLVVFRGAYEQIGNTVAIWADISVDRHLGNWVIPASWFQSLNPLLVLLLTPLYVRRSIRSSQRARAIPSAVRMSSGAAVVACAYLILAATAAASGGHPQWPSLAAFFMLLTAGELSILPVGLELFGRLAPARRAALAMAVWFSSGFAGNLLAGALGSIWDRLTPPPFFMLMSLIAALSAALLLMLNRPIRRAEADALAGDGR